MKSASLRPVALSMGDMNGIGPEIILKTLVLPEFSEFPFVITGSISAMVWWRDRTGLSVPLHRMDGPSDLRPGSIGVWSSATTEQASPEPGELSRMAGHIAISAIEDAVHLCLHGQARALVTAPISKEAVASAGLQHPGHTEFLAELTGCREDEVMMLLWSEDLCVGLLTIHEPLGRVAGLVSEERIARHLSILHRALQERFGVEDPLIDVLGLNPHAGDGGVIGTEEADIIRPALQAVGGIRTRGPFPADAYFGKSEWRHSDAVLACYHDQGLIPFKMLAFDSGVNVTLGLPIVRTSPDHGTAFDIAGKNIADSSSFLHAVRLAIRMSSG